VKDSQKKDVPAAGAVGVVTALATWAAPAMGAVEPRRTPETGMALGADSPIYVVAILATFATVWGFFFVGASKDDFIRSGGETDESGLSGDSYPYEPGQ